MTRRAVRTAGALLVGVFVASCGRSGGSQPPAAASTGEWRTVTDMRGVDVRVPQRPSRVATVDDGFVEGVMTRLGVIRTLVAVGSAALQDTWSYSYPAPAGGSWSVADGMGTMRAIHPWLADLPSASGRGGDAVNIETLAAARPDLVILRTGDCTLGLDSDAAARVGSLLESLQIPVVVLRSTAVFRNEGLDSLRQELQVLGRVFGRESDAAALSNELAAVEEMVQARVADTPDAVRPTALYLGLASGARESGGAAYVWGTETTESWMLERLAGGRNAYRGLGARVLLNVEQLLALDPDVILLPTSAGYHPPRELTEAPYFRDLRRLKAVRTGRVYPMPWTPQNCARRLEYPIDLMVMAKALRPERFRDMLVYRWVLDFYKTTYRVDEKRAKALRKGQWLDWTVDANF